MDGSRGRPARWTSRGRRRLRSVAGLVAAAVAVFGLEHVLDVVLEQHDVGRALAVDLESAAVVPLDGALDLLAVGQHDYHQRVLIHLLLVVEDFGARLGGRNLLAPEGGGRRGLAGRGGLARLARGGAPGRAVLRGARRRRGPL